jgi:hypothetical protein
MHFDALSVLSLFAAAPYVFIAGVLLLYFVRRAASKPAPRHGRMRARVIKTSAGLGAMFLFTLSFYRPSLAHTIEAIQREDADQDDEGDPETPAKQLHRQLKRIRRGEHVGTLVLRQ